MALLDFVFETGPPDHDHLPWLDKLSDEGCSVCVDQLLALVDIAESLQLLTFSVFLLLGVDLFDVDLLHAQGWHRSVR